MVAARWTLARRRDRPHDNRPMARTRNDALHAEKRAAILGAAARLFVENGFHQTGMAAICAAAGMSPGALYRYFPSKADIIRAIVEEERAEAAILLSSLGQGGDFRARLIDALDAAISAAAAPDYARLALEIAAEGARDPAIGALLKKSEDDLRKRLTKEIAGAAARGEIDAADPGAAAAIILMLIDGASGAGAVFAGLRAKARRAALTRLVAGMVG